MEFLDSSWLFIQSPKKEKGFTKLTVKMEYLSGQIFSVIHPQSMDDIHEEAQKMFPRYELSIPAFPVSDCSVMVTKLNEFERLSKQIYDYGIDASIVEFHPTKKKVFVRRQGTYTTVTQVDLETFETSTMYNLGLSRNFTISRSGQYIATLTRNTNKNYTVCLYSFPDLNELCTKHISSKNIELCWGLKEDNTDELQVGINYAWHEATLDTLDLTHDRRKSNKKQLRDKRNLTQGIQTHKYQVFESNHVLNLETQEKIYWRSFCSQQFPSIRYNDKWIFHKDYLFAWNNRNRGSNSVLKISNLKTRTIQVIEIPNIRTVKCHPKYRILGIHKGYYPNQSVQIYYF
jgi:hypothetical protein